MMCNFFKPTSESEGADVARQTSTSSEPTANTITMEPATENQNFADLVNHPSDLSNDEDDTMTDDNEAENTLTEKSLGCQPAVPLRKRQKLDIPYRAQREQKRKQRLEDLENAFKDLEKLLRAKKTKFVGGMQGLQARRARTMESHLRLVVKNPRHFMGTSKQAAETHGFAANWGGRQVRSWTCQWMKTRELPRSMQGCHAKVYSLLSDPTIAAELRAYVRSNKWAMNPEKLTQFSQNKLIPSAADEYLHQITHEEMPQGLKQYMELELFPRIHVKVGHGVSLNTARRWLRCEGFRYISHKKGLYFDGHDRPDVVSYHQDHFLPTMKKHKPRFVRYTVGDVEKELEVQPANYVER